MRILEQFNKSILQHPRAIQQINFTANVDRAGNATILFIIEERKDTIFEFSQGTVKVL